MMANTKNEINQRVASSFCGRYKDLHSLLLERLGCMYTLVTSTKGFLHEPATIFLFSWKFAFLRFERKGVICFLVSFVLRFEHKVSFGHGQMARWFAMNPLLYCIGSIKQIT